MKRVGIRICLLFTVVALGACGTHNVKLEPVKVEPIHLTVDVNLHEDAKKP